MESFIYSQRGCSILERTKKFIDCNIVPLITLKDFKKSKKYKEAEKYLLDNEFVKEYRAESQKGSCIIPEHYAYIKILK